MKTILKKISLSILLSVSSLVLFAQVKAQQAVKISGEVLTPMTIQSADFTTMPPQQVKRKDRDGKEHLYSGVSLSAILSKAGVGMGKALKGENLTKYIIVEASDGYQVIFSLAELDSEFSDNSIILADKVDGTDLPLADGPFRIIVESDKKPARCIKQVNSIKVAFAK